MTPLLTIKEAAAALSVSQQWLNYWLADNPIDVAGVPFYLPMGRRKKFEPQDIERIRNHMRTLEAARLGETVKSKVRLLGLMAQLGDVDQLLKTPGVSRQAIAPSGSGLSETQLGDLVTGRVARPSRPPQRRARLPKA